MPNPSKQILLEVRAASKSFGDLEVLKQIDFAVHEGEVIAILGPSGSGKSTLLRCLNQLETLDAGEIFYRGEPVPKTGKALDHLRQEVGMVFQQFHLFPHLTVKENLCLVPVHLGKCSKEEAREKAAKLLARVGLSDKADVYPSTLSGGQKQRVAIARALAMEPSVLLFDEATSALDPEMVQEVLDVIRDLAKEGLTMILVTHEMGFAAEASNRVLLMDGGVIVEDSESKAFFSAPKEERSRQFLSTYLA